MLDLVRSLFRMSAKRFETVNDLCRFGANLKLTCSCGHVAIVDAEQLFYQKMQRNWPASIGTLARKLVCSRCGQPPKDASPSVYAATVRIGPTVMEEAVARQAAKRG